MKGTIKMHAFIAAVLIFNGCINCPPTNTTTTVIVGTNVFGSITMSNGVLVVNATVPSNQVDAVSSSIGTNSTQSQIIIKTP